VKIAYPSARAALQCKRQLFSVTMAIGDPVPIFSMLCRTLRTVHFM